MLIFTIQNTPEFLEVKKIFTMICCYKAIEISDKGVVRGFLERNSNEYQGALDYFISLAPTEANGIIGVQVSTSTQQFGNGTFLYIHFAGTPVYFESK